MKPIRQNDFDTTTRPQDDFYQFANGGWLSRHTIPPSENRWGSFHILHQQNRKQLHAILKHLPKESLRPGSDDAKLRDLYLSAMDMRTRERQGTQYLREGFDTIAQFSGGEDIPHVFGYLHIRGVSVPWELHIGPDDKCSRRTALYLSQGGLGVPERDYLVKSDSESRRITRAYKTYIRQLLRCEGVHRNRDIPQIVRTIIRIETELAHASMTREQERDVHATYNLFSQAQLQQAYPHIPWKRYFDALGVPSAARRRVIVSQPKFIAAVDRLLGTVSAEVWRTYLRWHFLDAYAGTLGRAFFETRFAYYGKAIQGLDAPPEPWKRGVQTATALMPDALDRRYVRAHFPSSAKRQMRTLADTIKAAFRDRLAELSWMNERTKQHARKKLDTMTIQLGYPEKWRSYRSLQIDRTSFTQNTMAAMRFEHAYDMWRLTRPTDPTEWYMPASAVNAYYVPTLNQMTFPAGILQPPFFYTDADPAINYGAIGTVIAHELTHGFDDQGSQFDAHGNLREWWSDADRKRFRRRTRVLKRQFDQYTVCGGIPLNGGLTLGENIADLGGLVIAYDGFTRAVKDVATPLIDGFTPEQRFFLAHAIMERCLTRDAYLKFQARNDVHAPAAFRSNVPVSNCDAFYRAFGVTPGDALYRPPQERARIW